MMKIFENQQVLHNELLILHTRYRGCVDFTAFHISSFSQFVRLFLVRYWCPFAQEGLWQWYLLCWRSWKCPPLKLHKVCEVISRSKGVMYPIDTHCKYLILKTVLNLHPKTFLSLHNWRRSLCASDVHCYFRQTATFLWKSAIIQFASTRRENLFESPTQVFKQERNDCADHGRYKIHTATQK